MGADNTLPGDLLVLDSVITEIDVTDVVIDRISHGIPSSGSELRQIHVADNEQHGGDVEGALILRQLDSELTLAGIVDLGVDVFWVFPLR